MAKVSTVEVFSSLEVAAGTSDLSSAITINQVGYINGFFSLQYLVSGSGTASFEYVCSNDGVNYYTPDGGGSIKTGITAGGGILSFTPPVCESMKIKGTETGSSNSVTITATVAIS